MNEVGRIYGHISGEGHHSRYARDLSHITKNEGRSAETLKADHDDLQSRLRESFACCNVGGDD